METDRLQKTALQLMATGKGILAADESNETCNKRFAVYGISEDGETRRKWRELLFTTPQIEEGLSGIILFDETIRQQTKDGVLFPQFLSDRGILTGIKVDEKTERFNGSDVEVVTKGLEGLSERLSGYARMGAVFAKWRAVIRIGEGLPTQACVAENARRLAEYAFACQQAGIVPIIEPEVLFDGTHTMEHCEDVLEGTLQTVFAELKAKNVLLSGLILKSSMVLPGKQSGIPVVAKDVAKATVRVLEKTVPDEVAGIVFLSGGQTPLQATDNLNEMERIKGKPWPLTFSYSRALQEPVLAYWSGKEENVEGAQALFQKRVAEADAASEGEWTEEME